MGNQKIILVFGLSGVGKSTLVHKVLENRNDFERVSGGSLIDCNKKTENRDELRVLPSDEILDNQKQLIKNFAKVKTELGHKHIIFDGHCIIKNGPSITEVPTDIIKKLFPNIIVFVEATAKEIIERRKNDSSRPNREIETTAQINENICLQKNICSKYSSELGVPLEFLNTAEPGKFAKILDAIINPK